MTVMLPKYRHTTFAADKENVLYEENNDETDQRCGVEYDWGNNYDGSRHQRNGGGQADP